MAVSNSDQYDELLKRLHISFANRALFIQALTHRSYLSDAPGEMSNERLEFLGDAVLTLLLAEELYRAHPDWPEGDLTKARAFAVDERALALLAQRWGLGPFLRVSHGEDTSRGRERKSLLADAVEAIIGAYYLDRGLGACRRFVLRQMADVLVMVDRREYERDYKTQLQEALQARYQSAPTYQVVEESGPPHDRTFEVVVTFRDEVLGHGTGKSKKGAEQQAALQALESLPGAAAPTE